MAASFEPGEDLYVPVGIEEVEREGAPPKKPKERAAPKASAGATDFEFVRGGARHTLDGLKNFEWAALFGTLSNYLAIPVVLLLAAVAAVDLGDLRGLASLAAWILGVGALGLFVVAAFFVILGAWAFHIGKEELGILQRREVKRAEVLFWRGVYALIPGAGVALMIGFQESTLYRNSTIPYATVFALAAGFVSAVIASRYFAGFLVEYLRNLTPKTGKRGRRRFGRAVVVAASIPLAVVLAGTPLLFLDYEQACTFFGACPADEYWALVAPSYGPPAHITPHLADYLPIPTVAGLVVIAGLLAVGRVFAFLALRSFRAQVREAEIFLREKVRLHAPAPMPPG